MNPLCFRFFVATISNVCSNIIIYFPFIGNWDILWFAFWFFDIIVDAIKEKSSFFFPFFIMVGNIIAEWGLDFSFSFTFVMMDSSICFISLFFLNLFFSIIEGVSNSTSKSIILLSLFSLGSSLLLSIFIFSQLSFFMISGVIFFSCLCTIFSVMLSKTGFDLFFFSFVLYANIKTPSFPFEFSLSFWLKYEWLLAVEFDTKCVRWYSSFSLRILFSLYILCKITSL